MEVLYSISILIFSIFLITVTYFLKQKKKKLWPPSPPAIPILGHLHLLKSTAPHLVFQKLSIKYGPLISLRFGIRPILVVSSPSLAEECFTKTNDIIFANRPYSIATKHLSYNSTALISSPYGDHWRNLRRVTTINIFSSISLHHFSSIWTEEIRSTVQKLFQSSSDDKAWKVVNLNSLFLELVFNVIIRIVAAKRWPSDQSTDVFSPHSIADLCDYIPILRWIGYGGLEKKVISIHGERDKFVQDLVDETRKNRGVEGDSSSAHDPRRTIVEALFALQDAEPEYYTDEIIKGIMQTMFTAGTHTTAHTMERAMSSLLDHSEVLQKARNEIDNHITQSGQLLKDSDLSKLPYLRCITNETLRLFSPTPTLVPHYSSEDCTIGGYKVPKGTTLLVNAWAIHRDPNLWEEPSNFKPERFEGIDEGFKFLPFGKGRRACPGSALAMKLVGLTLGTLVQCFEWERVRPEMVDMDEKFGVTVPKTEALKALYKPRLSMDKVCLAY